MKVLLVVAHPRHDSLTFAAAKAFAEAATVNGHQLEWADLVAEGFDPVLRHPDEPDWSNSNKTYSDAVQREMARIERNEATVIVFPVYWWSMPAILKGWIEGGAKWGRDPIDPFRYTTATRAGYDWWALQPVKRPTVPASRDRERSLDGGTLATMPKDRWPMPSR